MADNHNNEHENIAKRRKIIRNLNRNNPTSEDKPNRVEDTVQTCGLIQQIVLKNVMCHEYLNFSNFTSAINLIQGRNGSGKSTIVAAIIAGLGGASRTTDRGSSLKNLIQNGKTSATIEIHLKNLGCLAYKHELYGDRIIVERRLVLSGSNSYKIKSFNGDVISTKKEDLTRILNWFNFQVDNPVLILSQERAKTFLSSTDPRELFKLFMKATYLQQFEDDLKIIMSELDSLHIILNSKKEILGEFGKEVKKWENKVHIIKTLANKRTRITVLQKEKAWAKIRDDEDRLKQLKKESNSEESILEKIISALEKLKNTQKELEANKSKIDGDLVALADRSQHNETERSGIVRLLADIKQNYRTHANKKKYLEKEIEEKDRDIDILKERLEKDFDEVNNAWKAENARIEAAKADLHTRLNESQCSHQTEMVHLNHLQQNLRREEEELSQFICEEKALISRVATMQRELHSAQSNKNSMSVFGHNMPLILEEINEAHQKRQFQNEVNGPIGKHVKIKDPQWAHIAEKVLGKLITGFQVYNQHDMHVLKNIFKRVIPNEQQPTIIISPFRNQLHDYKRYETSTDAYSSLWSLLETDNIQVANTLLDQLNCEQILLIPTAEEAASILTDEHTVPPNCKKAYTLNCDLYFPDPNYKIYSGMGPQKAKFLQVSLEEKVGDLIISLKTTENEIRELKKEVKLKQESIKNLKKEIDHSNTKTQQYQSQIRKLYGELEILKNEEVAAPPDAAQLEKDLDENQEKKTKALEEANEIEMILKQIQTEMNEKKNIHTNFQRESEVIHNESNQLQDVLNELNRNIARVKLEIGSYQKKKKEQETSVSSFGNTVYELEEKIKLKIKMVTSVNPERINTRRSIVDIDREIVTLEDAVKKAEESHGDVKTVVSTFREKLDRYQNTKNDISGQKELIDKISRNIDPRSNLFHSNRKLCSLLLNTTFNNKISTRNLSGKIYVNHEQRRLEISIKRKVAKKNNAPASECIQSLKMMSGGERSFATVSFIISLWDMTASPVRIMDEFDIFMDVVSKKQCIDMIVANANKNAQHILISPQEYRVGSETLTVFKMPDPERGSNRRTQ